MNQRGFIPLIVIFGILMLFFILPVYIVASSIQAYPYYKIFPFNLFQSKHDVSGLPTGFVTEEEISSHPEVNLYYPNSKLISQYINPEHFEREVIGVHAHVSGASVRNTMNIDDSGIEAKEKIYSWYENWLLTHGWSYKGAALRAGEESGQEYSKGLRERFFIYIYFPYDPNDPSSFPPDLPKIGTNFYTWYIIKPYQH